MDAEKELKSARTSGALRERLARSKSVPPKIRRIFKRAYEQEHWSWGRHKVVGADGVGELFEGMSDDTLRKLIKTLLPNLIEPVEQAWRALRHKSYDEKSFRHPNASWPLADVRGRWLLTLAYSLGDYDRDITWIATWAAHLTEWRGASDVGWLLAGALDRGDAEADQVFEILKASVTGDHAIARMGRHVTQAFMASSHEDAWEFNEQLLLAAQRQEGLRQVILETVDESHPEAFRRMLRLILDHDLTRFSSVVRAADVWFGFIYDAPARRAIDEAIETTLTFLNQPDERATALAGNEPTRAHLALWAYAFEDVESAVEPAARLLESASAEMRFVGTHFLTITEWKSADRHLVDMLRDDDLRVAARAEGNFRGNVSGWVNSAEVFDALEHLLNRLDKKPLVFEHPWWEEKLARSDVAYSMSANAEAVPLTRMLVHMKDLDSYSRADYVARLASSGRGSSKRSAVPNRPSEEVYAVLIDLLGDASSHVRATTFEALASSPAEPRETARLVNLLSRKAEDVRRLSIARLLTLPDDEMLDVADTLLADGTALRRLAGLEILRQAHESERACDRVQTRVYAYHNGRTSISVDEQTHIDAILDSGDDVPGVHNALGLVDPDTLPTWIAAEARDTSIDSDAASRCVEALAEMIFERQDIEVEHSARDKTLFINSSWRIPEPQTPARAEEQVERLPFADAWRAWEAGRGEDLRDDDGLELVRAYLARPNSLAWTGPHATKLPRDDWSAPGEKIGQKILLWCIYWQSPRAPFDGILDVLESSLARMSPGDLDEMAAWSLGDRDQDDPFKPQIRDAGEQLDHLRTLRALLPEEFRVDHGARLYALLRWFSLRCDGYNRLTIQLDDFADAYAATRISGSGVDEFIDLLIGRHTDIPNTFFGGRHTPIFASQLVEQVSGRATAPEIAAHPELHEAFERCRRRIVEIEVQRGDVETFASAPAAKLQFTGGLETLAVVMAALANLPFDRSVTTDWAMGNSRKTSFSRLVFHSSPRHRDTLEEFAEWTQRAKVRDVRLVELAVFAPQWARHVEHALGWTSFESAVWWLHAHTRESGGNHDNRSQREMARIGEHTPLTIEELSEGAVDVAWFHEIYADLGAERWALLDKAAKLISDTNRHTRAKLFASALSGKTKLPELRERIDDKRHQDSVRALGLVPLATGKRHDKDLLTRYEHLQEFKRESRKHGPQRQASEAHAFVTAMENLARTAGFSDPLRLQWAMEMESVKDLADGPVTVVKDEVTVALSVDDAGQPKLSVVKKGKTLKAIPAKLRKDRDIVALKERVKDLRRQAARVKSALEEAMCRADEFEGAELQALLRHPVLAPSLARVVFVGERIIGYPAADGQALADHKGTLEPLIADEHLRIAHPLDLLDRGDWPTWQRECFRTERIQPFKQVFREAYPRTEAEGNDAFHSQRYVGHQVNPSQALALLKTRGWTAHPEEGVTKTFHRERLTARVAIQETFYTPADVEGLTLELVAFTKKSTWDAVELASVPERVFSETMRDLDLVVSVAHMGGVDPEASASTLEMRAALLRECCRLLELDNVDVKSSHAVIRGEYGNYSVHLGSAIAGLLGGPSLVIIAVPSQHRGRLFLPFADDDPRTAEVLSKVLLLSRDREIQDPNILDQIRHAQR